MTEATATLPQSRFKAGWILLFVLAGLMTLNHAVLLFVLDEPALFAGYTVFNLYAMVVLAIPFRRRERWAWYTTWLLPLGLALPAAADGEIAIYYYGVAAVCVLGLLLTMSDFLGAEKRRQG